MDFEKMKEYLSSIQQNSFETKVLSAILTCYEQVCAMRESLIETQQKMNEIIAEINEDAETTNSDIQEDTPEEAPVKPDPASDNALEEVE